MSKDTSAGSGNDARKGEGAHAPDAELLETHRRNPSKGKDYAPLASTAELTPHGAPDTLTVKFKHRLKGREYQSEDYGITVAQTLSWRSAWLRAVALAWSDESKDGLRDQLCADPFKFIRNHCGYTLPKTVNLVVVPDPNSKFERGDDDVNGWEWTLTQNMLVMFLPDKPKDSSASDALIALAAFESVGSAYPFTMTC
jgi:ribosomally synthesized peptide (two-chain TOMM family)